MAGAVPGGNLMYGRARKMIKQEEAVSPVIAIILMVAITVVLAGVLYMWVMSLANVREEPEYLVATLDDGVNEDPFHGCFFTIRAGMGTNIDPGRYSFYVAENGHSPNKLDFAIREYRDYAPYDPEPDSGDRNRSYDHRIYGDMWSDGEYIGFDMPMEDLNIDINDGGQYEVLIKNSEGSVVLQDIFVYKEQ